MQINRWSGHKTGPRTFLILQQQVQHCTRLETYLVPSLSSRNSAAAARLRTAKNAVACARTVPLTLPVFGFVFRRVAARGSPLSQARPRVDSTLLLTFVAALGEAATRRFINDVINYRCARLREADARPVALKARLLPHLNTASSATGLPGAGTLECSIAGSAICPCHPRP